ncbi:MAG: pyrroline-5-carboxylate reductase [Rickettsiales bacterium]|nr:pyrroline-5-carboxylate reductase [Rickettsiales bacterium]
MIDKIFFLGCGKMGSEIANNLVHKSGFNPKKITVLKKTETNLLPKLNYIKNTSLLPKNYKADLVFIAIKPQDSAEILAKFAKENIFHQNTIFISILAGKKIAFFNKFFGSKAKIIRGMPNLPIKESQGIFPYFVNKNINNDEKKSLHKIFNNFGQAFLLKDEKSFDIMTAIFGSGPAYIFYLEEVLAGIAVKSGIKKDEADSLIRTLFLGSSLMSSNSNLSFAELRKSVTSKGGVTEAALKTLSKNSSLEKLFKQAITDAAKKSKDLSK